MPDTRPTIDEPLLVLRCQAGDEAALTELVARYHRRVHYYLKKMLGSADRADDALQEVWVDVFRSITKLRDPGAFASWLYRIARDRAFRVIRKDAKPQAEMRADLDVAEELDDDSFADPAEVHAALDKLSDDHREVLLLRFVESMTYPEIAAVVGCELGTVRSRIHYAKRALRQELERNHHEPERFRIRAE